MSEFMAFVVAGLLGNLSFDSGLRLALAAEASAAQAGLAALAGSTRLATSQDKQAAAPAAPGRPDLTEPQIKALRDKNIFSPFRTKPFPPKIVLGSGPGTPRVEVPSRPKPLVLTGIVYDASSGAFQAVVEDKSDEKLRRLAGPKFLKAGDEVLGVKIEAVQKDRVVVVHGETRKEIGAGDPLPDTAPAAPEVTPGAAAPSSAIPGVAPEGKPAPVEAKPAEPGVVNSVLEELRKKNKKKDRTYDEP